MKNLYVLILICSPLIAQDMNLFTQRLNQLQMRVTNLQQTATQLGLSQVSVAPVPDVSPVQTVLRTSVMPQPQPIPVEEPIAPVVPPVPAVSPEQAVLKTTVMPKPQQGILTQIPVEEPVVPSPAVSPEQAVLRTTVMPQPQQGVLTQMPVVKAKTIVPVATYNSLKIGDPDTALLQEVSKRTVFDPFKYVMGITEPTFQKKSDQEKFKYVRSPLGQTRVGDPNAPGFFAGAFKEYSINELRSWYAQRDHGNGCKFFVQEAVDRPYDDGKGNPNWFLAKFDIGAMQAAKENRDAVFQIASNFNGLEGGGSPAAGIMPYLTEGLYVQGEAAAVSAMPGLIYRMYFVPHAVNGVQYFGQLQQQLNFLSDIPAITIVDGYPQSVNLSAFQNLSAQAYDDLVKKVHIGFQEGIQVTSGLGALRGKGELLGANGFKAVKIDDSNQHVAQVLTAAFNLAGTTNPQYRTVARMLLDAAYEGTMKSAYINGKRVVYLTLVGGGVFKNDPEWIVDAILKALNDFVNKGNMEIVLMIYALPGDKAKADDLRKKLLSYTRAMNGSYLQFKTDGLYRLNPV